MRSFVLLLLLLVYMGVASATGNPTGFPQQLEKALDEYEAGRLTAAIEILNGAIDLLWDELDPKSMTIFPEPFPGWRADPPAKTPKGPYALLMGKGVVRQYLDPSTTAIIMLSVISDSPAIRVLHSMASRESPPGTETFSLHGNPGIEEHFPDRRVCQLTLIVDESLLIQAKGENVPDCDVVRKHLERINLAMARKLFGQ